MPTAAFCSGVPSRMPYLAETSMKWASASGVTGNGVPVNGLPISRNIRPMRAVVTMRSTAG